MIHLLILPNLGRHDAGEQRRWMHYLTSKHSVVLAATICNILTFFLSLLKTTVLFMLVPAGGTTISVNWFISSILARSYTHASPWRCTGWTSLWDLGSRLHRVGTVGSSTAKSGLIYYLAKLAWAVTGTRETAKGGWAGKVERRKQSLGESQVAVDNKTKTWARHWLLE